MSAAAWKLQCSESYPDGSVRAPSAHKTLRHVHREEGGHETKGCLVQAKHAACGGHARVAAQSQDGARGGRRPVDLRHNHLLRAVYTEAQIYERKREKDG